MEGEGGPSSADRGQTGGKKAEAPKSEGPKEGSQAWTGNEKDPGPKPQPEAKTQAPDAGPTTTSDGEIPPLDWSLFREEEPPGGRTDATSDVPPPDSKENQAAREGTARKLSESLFAQKTAALKAEVGTERQATPEEKALLFVDAYKNGFQDETYQAYKGKIPIENGLKVTLPDGSEVTVQTLDGQQKNIAGETEFICTVDEQTDPVTISGADLAKTHMAQNAAAIAGNFDNIGDMTLAEWYANGAQGDIQLSDFQLDNMSRRIEGSGEQRQRREIRADDDDPVGDVISSEIDKLSSRLYIQDKDGNLAYKVTDEKLKLKMEKQLAGLQTALQAKGEFGAITRMAILKGMRRPGDPAAVGIDRILRDDTLQQQHEQAMKDVEEFADKKGLTEGQKKDLLKAIQNPEELPKLMEAKNETLSEAADEAVRGIFGREPSDGEIDAMFDTLIDTHEAFQDTTLKEKVKKAFTEKKTKKLLLLALILGAIPVALVGVAAAGGVAVTANMAGASRKG